MAQRMDPVLIQKKVLIISCWKTAPCHLIPVKTLRLFVSTVGVKLLNHIRLFVTPWAVAGQVPLHGISQTSVLDWVAISVARGSS